MELHKIGVKILFSDGSSVDLLEFIPVFHRWIQNRALGDLLIDVADYSHVPSGPGILLVGHEGNYAVDETGDRRGLVYYHKRPLGGSLAERLATVWDKAVTAYQLLERDEELKGRIGMQASEFQVFSNDRLAAPNSAEAAATLGPVVDSFFARILPHNEREVIWESDPKERLSATVKVSKPVTIDSLAEQRLAS